MIDRFNVKSSNSKVKSFPDTMPVEFSEKRYAVVSRSPSDTCHKPGSSILNVLKLI